MRVSHHVQRLQSRELGMTNSNSPWYSDSYDPALHGADPDPDTDQPYNRCPLCRSTIAALCLMAALAAFWYAPWLAVAFAAGCVTALWFSE